VSVTGGRERPKILLVIDKPGWAFDILADDIIRYAGDRFDFSKAYKSKLPSKEVIKGNDLIYSFWWGRELQKDLFRRGANPARLTTVISSMKRWESSSQELGRLRRQLREYSVVGVISKELEQRLSGVHPRLVLTRHGVDKEKFCLRRPVSSEGNLVVGWAGSTKYADLKGLDSVIRPAIEGLEGVELSLAVEGEEEGPGARSFAHEEMHEFYNSIDVYLCASSSEGGPLPVLEAAACGRAVISTKVGIVPELIEHERSGFLVERSPAAFRAAIEVLRDERSKTQEMGLCAREEVERCWDWSVKIDDYIAFFEAGLVRASELEARGLVQRFKALWA